MRLNIPLAAFAACLLFAPLSVAAPTRPTPKDFARAPAISDVSVSPDGKHIVALVSPDGVNQIVTIWRTDALAERPVTIGAAAGRFLGAVFLKNDKLLITFVQTLDFADENDAIHGHIIKSFVTGLDGKGSDPILPERGLNHSAITKMYDQLTDASIVSVLPRDPQNVLVEDGSVDGAGDVYKVNVYTHEASRIMHGSEKYDGYQVDLNGAIRARVYTDFENGKIFIAQQVRDSESSPWVELFRSYAKDRSITSIVGFTSDPNVVLISSTKDSDKTGIYAYDTKQRKILEPEFEHRLFEAGFSPILSMDPADFGRPLGFNYSAEHDKIYWVDGKMASIQDGLDKALGGPTTTVSWIDPGTGLQAPLPVSEVADVTIDSMSYDRKAMIIEKSGPRQPPQYYLLLDGSKLTLLGKSRPGIDPAALGETQLVQYPARDGLLIPALLTTPPKAVFGPGPYPTLIEPHGGPWGRDEMDWDVTGWVQYFASHGYAVLQPQFRGSEGWGQKLWRAGDNEWGQKMGDDNDDGVKYLVSQHIADPARVAIFGYSYGGYAALAAAIRPGNVYQCAISGAGAGDLHKVAEQTYDDRFQREFQNPTIGGLDSLGHVGEVHMPVFLYHGDRDRTVDIDQSRKFAAALRSSGKPFHYVEIKDMGHQLTYWTPAMGEQQLVEVESFLHTGCKAGGL